MSFGPQQQDNTAVMMMMMQQNNQMIMMQMQDMMQDYQDDAQGRLEALLEQHGSCSCEHVGDGANDPNEKPQVQPLSEDFTSNMLRGMGFNVIAPTSSPTQMSYDS